MNADDAEKAMEIARRAHAGQVDKSGQPYHTHPKRYECSYECSSDHRTFDIRQILLQSQIRRLRERMNQLEEQLWQLENPIPPDRVPRDVATTGRCLTPLESGDKPPVKE